MAKNPVRRQPKKIDTIFHIPEGVDELVYADFDDDFGEPEGEAGIDIIIEDPIGGDGLDTPNILRVVSQTLRTTSNGNQVVDIVIEVEDVYGADKYETRVTKL